MNSDRTILIDPITPRPDDHRPTRVYTIRVSKPEQDSVEMFGGWVAGWRALATVDLVGVLQPLCGMGDTADEAVRDAANRLAADIYFKIGAETGSRNVLQPMPHVRIDVVLE